MPKKTIGIIGGMGPLATVDLFRKIVEYEDAATDQDHVRVLIDNNTGIPDRTKALISGGEDPLPQLTDSARRLAAIGADFLIMPCNTAHAFYRQLQAASPIPVLNMIEETGKSLASQGIHSAGLLATRGTLKIGIYPQYLTDIELFYPTREETDFVMSMIYDGVKAGRPYEDTAAVQCTIDRLLSAGAKTIILGCTELPLAKEMYNLEMPTTDPTLELAKAAIRKAGGRVKAEL